jgi:hypothetical protein
MSGDVIDTSFGTPMSSDSLGFEDTNLDTTWVFTPTEDYDPAFRPD